MATTYTWSFSPLEAAPTEGDLENVVKTIHWRLTGTTDDAEPISGTVYGSCGAGEADGDSFTAFADLTEADVKGWTLAAIAEGEETAAETEARLKAQVDTQIDAIKNPPIVTKTAPWE